MNYFRSQGTAEFLTTWPAGQWAEITRAVDVQRNLIWRTFRSMVDTRDHLDRAWSRILHQLHP